MEMPQHSVTLTAEEISDLAGRLSALRHNINNHLSIMSAAAEVLARKPELAQQIIGNLLQQPPKISEQILKFSHAFETTLRIKRD